MAELPGQLELFDGPARKRPARVQPVGNGKPRWLTYKAKRAEKCDACFILLVKAGGLGPLTRPARWRRITNGTPMYLCSPHAEDYRVFDNLPPLPKDKT